MMLFAVLLFASCNKEAGEPQPQKEQKHYSLSLDVAASTDENGYKALDHLNYKFQNGKVKPDLVPGEEIEVYTEIFAYKGAKIEYGGYHNLKWRVSDDGKKLYCKQTLSDVTFNPNDCDRVTLIAGIYAMRDHSDKNYITPLPENNEVKVFTATTSSAFSMKVPYFLPEMELKKDAQGIYVNKLLANNKFKPKGYLLKVHVKNELNEPLSLSGVQSCGLVPDFARFPSGKGSIADLLKDRPLKGHYNTSYYTNRKFSFSQSFTVPAGATSSEAFLMWLPEMINNADYLIDLIVKDVPSQAFYVSKLFTKSSPSEYVEGNMYTVTLTVRPIRNPLEYLSEYAVNKDGTDFLTNWSDFAPEEKENFTTKNKEVGYFDGLQVTMRGGGNDLSKALILAGEEYSYPNGGAGVKWHLPTIAEWNSVFTSWVNSPVQIGKYKGLFGPASYNSSGQSGNTYEVYTLCFNPLLNDMITKDRIAGVLTTPLPAFPTAGSWYWFKGDDQDRAAFLPEISENKRYAFYYRYDYTTHMMTIKCKYVGADPEFTTAEDVKNKINWSSVTTSRTIPAYSVKAHYYSHYSGEHVPPGRYPDINEIELRIPDAIYLWAEELTLGRNYGDAAILYNNLACANFGPDRGLRLRGISYAKGGVFTGTGIKFATAYYGNGWHADQTLYYPVYLFRKFQ